MKASWTSGLDADAAKEIKEGYVRSLLVRKRLASIIEDKTVTAYKALRSRDMFNLPKWELAQAERIGYINALEDLMSLITDKDK